MLNRFRFTAVCAGGTAALTFVAGASIGLSTQASESSFPQDSPPASDRTVRDILQSYVKDFREDRFASDPMLFGITVPGEGAWHVRVTGERDELDRADKPRWGVTLHDGPAPEPTLLYRIEAATLRAIDRGEINALTAQAKMFATDFAPMDAIEMPGYEPTAEEDAKVNPFSFHFWTRGFPEVIPFGDGMTRVAHGADVAVFYYQEGIRTTWLRMKPGVRVRDDAREQAAPFPMLGVTIKGTSRGIVDGAPITLQAGNTVFIPANVMHKWWNEGDEDAEVILIMFGEGA